MLPEESFELNSFLSEYRSDLTGYLLHEKSDIFCTSINFTGPQHSKIKLNGTWQICFTIHNSQLANSLS